MPEINHETLRRFLAAWWEGRGVRLDGFEVEDVLLALGYRYDLNDETIRDPSGVIVWGRNRSERDRVMETRIDDCTEAA